MREAHHPSHDGALATQNEFVLHAKDVADLAGASVHAAHVDPAQHVNGHFVVDDAHLLFSGKFSKSGNDLVVSGDGREVTVHDYFKGEVRAPLYAPDGSSLSGQAVTALAGHSSYAQAGDPAPAADTAIGQVAKLTGTATAIRNGVAVELHVGDKVYKGDVLEAGAESALGITFVDGTAFSLGSHARMVLNEMVYDPNGSSNSSFLSLVQGSITFVAGQTAKNGSMKIDTPVATMGIRGTAVFVDISANDGPTKFSVLVEPGNHVGSYELFNKVTGDKIGEVSTAGIQVLITPTGFNQLSISEQAKTLADLQAEQALIQQVFSMAFEKVNDANPKFNFGSIGSGVSPFGGEYFYPFNPQSPPTIKLTSLGSGSDDNKVLTVTLSIPADPPPIVKVTNVSTVQAGGVSDVTVTQSSTPGTKTFSIGDQVKIIDPSVGVPPFFDIAVNYVKGTAVLLSAVGPATLSTPVGTAVPGNFLASLISIDTTTGVVSYDPSKFQFLGQGETAVYTIQFDSYGGPSGHDEANNAPYTVIETITLTVLGLNDPPVFSGSGSYQYSSNYATAVGGSSAPQALGTGTAASTPVVTAALTERPGLSGATAPDAVTIQLPFTDQDFSDVAKNYSVKLLQVSASGITTGLPQDQTALATELSSFLTYQGLTKGLNSINGNITEAFSAPDNTFDYLAAGEQLTISYTIQVTDPHGATSTEVLNIVVTGTNDVPVIQSSQVKDPGPLQAPVAQPDGSWIVASNTYTFTDPDLSDTHTTNAVFDAADSNLHGLSAPIGTIASTLITDSKGGVVGEFGWTLTLSAADLAELYNPKLIPPGTTIVESFDVSVSDFHGGTATKVVTIDIPTVDEWTGAGDDGLWSDPANWTAGVPGPISNVEIAPATATQVAISSSDTIFGLNTNGNATLDITAGTLTIAGPVTNTIAGPVSNSGIIAVESNLTVDGATITDTGSDAGLTVGSGDTLTLQDGAVVSGGTLTNAGTIDIETSTGATLDGVAVTNNGGTVQVDDVTSVLTVPLLLEDGTMITNGVLSIGGVGVVDVEAGGSGLGATLDGVTVNGTAPGPDIPGSLIDVGLTSAATLTLDDGTTIANGLMTIGENGVLAVENGGAPITGADATLDGVAVTNNGTIEVGKAGVTADPTLLLDDGTVITGGQLEIGTTGVLDVEAGTGSGLGATLQGIIVSNTTAGSKITVGASGPANLTLNDNAIVSGGTLSVGEGSTLTVEAGPTLTSGPGAQPYIVYGMNEWVAAAGGDFYYSAVAFNSYIAINAAGQVVQALVQFVGSPDQFTLASVAESTNPSLTEIKLVDNLDSAKYIEISTTAVDLADPQWVNSPLQAYLYNPGQANNVSSLNIGIFPILGATLDHINVTNSGTIQLTNGGALQLNDATISGGQIDSSGYSVGIVVEGSSAINDNALVSNEGLVVQPGVTLTLDDVTLNGVYLTPVSEFTSSNSEIEASVVVNDTLKLSDSAVAGGVITDNGAIEVVGSDWIWGAKLNNGGVTVDAGQTLTLDDVTVNGTNFTDTASGATLSVDATHTLTLQNGAVVSGGTLVNAGTVYVETSTGATLDGVAVTNSGGTIQVDDAAAATLLLDDGTIITGGQLTVGGSGVLDVESGGASITGADATLDGVTVANNGTIEIGTAAAVTVDPTLLLDDGTIITGGQLTIGASGVLDVESGGASITGADATLDGVTVTNNGTIEVGTAAAVTADPTLLLDDGTIITGGQLTIGATGVLDIKYGTTGPGATLNDVAVDATAAGGQIEVGATATLTLEGNASITGASGATTANITNAGIIEVAGAATLTDDVVGNTGTTQVDDGQTLTLSGTTIEGGTINDYSSSLGGTIDVVGSSAINGNATLNNGEVTVESGAQLTLDDVTVSGTAFTVTASGATLNVDGGATLTLEGNAGITGASGATTANITNAGTIEVAGAATLTDDVVGNTGTTQVDDGQTLTLSGTTIEGGTINDYSSSLGGTIDVVGASAIDGNATLNNGDVTVESGAQLTLDDVTVSVTAFTVTASGATLNVDGGDTLTLEGGAGITGASGATTANITNAGTIEVAGAAMLTDDVVGNTGTIQVDGTQTLKLSGTTIEGGTINDYSVSGGIIAGDIDVVGWSTINGNATLNNGDVTVESSQKLTLDNVTVNGTAFTDIASGATLSVDATDTLTLQDGAVVSGGTLTNAGTVYVEKTTGATLDGVTVTNTGGTIRVDEATSVSTVPLLLDDGTTITKGTLSIGGVGVVDVEKGAKGPGVTLDGVTVNGTAPGTDIPGSLIEVGVNSTATLTLDDGTTITNGLMTIGENGVLAIENGGALITGADATLDGVAVTNNGTILIGTTGVTADPTLLLDDGTVVTGGRLTIGATGVLDVESGTTGPGATLNNVAVNATAAGGQIEVGATATLKLEGGTGITGPGATTANITNAGTIEVAGAATLTNDVVGNTGTIQVDGTQTLKLSGTTIEGGTINDYSVSGSIIAGDIDVTGSSAINGNATINNGDVTIEGGQTLKLDNVTVNGTAFTDTASGATLAIDAGDTLTVGSGGMTVTGGAVALTGAELDVNGGQVLTLQVGVDVVGGGSGTLVGKGLGATVEIETVVGATFDGVKVENIAVVVDNIIDSTAIPLVLDDGTLISGGSLTIGGSGEVEIGTGGATVENLTVDNDSTLPAGLVIGAGDKLVLSGVTVDGTIDDGTGTTPGTAGTIEIAGFSIISGATLNNGGVTVDGHQRLTLDNVTVNGTTFTDTASGATLKVDGGDQLTLNGATIIGGTINDGTGTTVATAGSIEIATSSKISSATLNNGGVTVDANMTLTLDNVTVNGTAITLTAGGAALAIDSGDTLTLQNGASVTGGTIVNTGTLDFESSSGAVLTGVSVVNTGAHLQIDFELPWPAPATPLILQGGTSITGGELDIGSTSGELEIRSAAGASLIGVDVINAGPYGIQIDGGSILKLSGGDVTGGTIDDGTTFRAGTIEIVHSAGIDGADLNYGNVTVDANQTLTLDNDTVTGTTFADTASGATLAVDGGDTLTLQGGAAVSGGKLINAGTLDIESWSGASLSGVAVTNTGGTIQVDNEWPWPLPAEPLVLADGTTITGGQLEIGSTNGEVVVETPAGATLIDVAVTNGGPYGIEVADDSILTLDGSSVTGGTVTNDGTMSVDGGKTLTLSGVTITGGTINDGTGSSAGTIVIAGSTTISGASLNHGGVTVDAGTALTLDNDHVTGTTFTDTARGATLQVDGGNTLALSGATIIGGTVDDGTSGRAGTIEIAGSSTIEGSSSVNPLSLNYGTVTVDSGKTLTLDNVATTTTTITNNGTIDVHAGSVKLGAAVSGSGTIDVDAGTTLEFGSSVSSGQTIDFTGAKGTIVLDQAQSFHATVAGFTGVSQSNSDLIDLANINFAHLTKDSYNATTELLTVSDGSHTAQIQFVGFSGSLHIVSDGHGGTLIYDPPATSSQDDQGSAPIVVAGNDVFMFGAGGDPKSSPELGQLPRTSWHDYFNPPADGGVGDGGHWAAAGDLHHGTGLLPATDPGYIDALLQKNGGHLAANDFILHPGAHPA